MDRVREYVSVNATFREDGMILPTEILWEDGRVFPIDRVLEIKRAASLKVGGSGIRYTCRIGRNQTYLSLDDNRCFVEKKVQRRDPSA